MSRLFYHVMQDNLGNLLFDVSGTMRIAGSGTLATIYGDEALTVILPNPMTNHPSYGSFKCFLPSGDFDFYMAKSGYSFETLTGVLGHGTMAQQDANAVAITGGNATLTSLIAFPAANANGVLVNDGTGTAHGFQGEVAAGVGKYNCFMNGTAPNFFSRTVLLRHATEVSGVPACLQAGYLHASTHGMVFVPTDSDTGSAFPCVFLNNGGATIGSISATASATAYNTTSDVRLKHDVDELTGELDAIQALRPVRFKWNADESDGVGFLAHEVAEHVQGVITGDANAVDEEGQIRPQMIDYSKLVPWLVGAIKTLAARVAVLEDALGV